MPFGGFIHFGLGGSIFGAKTAFLVHLPYHLNRLELSAHILSQGRSWDELVPLGCPINFGLGGSIFGAKNYDFGTFSITHECSSISAAMRRGGQCFWDKNKLRTLLTYMYFKIANTPM